MCPRRRTVLKAGAGIAGIGLVGGYVQRRRLKRWDAIEAFRSTTSQSIPSIDREWIVSDDHLRTAHARAVEQVDVALDTFDSDRFVDLRERLSTTYRPENVAALAADYHSIDQTRLELLAKYRFVRSSVVWELARRGSSAYDESAYKRRRAQVTEILDTTTPQYRGDSLSETILVVGKAEELLNRAGAWSDGARQKEPGNGDPNLEDRWRDIENAYALAQDAREILSARSGPSRESVLHTTFERLAHRVVTVRETTADATEWDFSAFHEQMVFLDLVPSPDNNVHFRHSRPEEGLEDGLAVAIRESLFEIPRMIAAWSFANIPHPQAWAEKDYEYGATGAQIRAEKREAISAVERVRKQYPVGNPLAARLCRYSLECLELADEMLGDLATKPNRYDDREWVTHRDEGVLFYRFGKLFAQAIPQTIAMISE
ncbi:hypothetical protein [Halorhabdus rudnickae]|uniref:hypothetical protein n=1 Tax=Halorhabdus rudnickae TaxID=1775544 RepID=UPI001083F340|nr:hypothetical protein [Halorhabdus rudnickae]